MSSGKAAEEGPGVGIAGERSRGAKQGCAHGGEQRQRAADAVPGKEQPRRVDAGLRAQDFRRGKHIRRLVIEAGEAAGQTVLAPQRRHHRDIAGLDIGPREIPVTLPERVSAMKEKHGRPRITPIGGVGNPGDEVQRAGSVADLARAGRRGERLRRIGCRPAFQQMRLEALPRQRVILMDERGRVVRRTGGVREAQARRSRRKNMTPVDRHDTHSARKDRAITRLPFVALMATTVGRMRPL